MNFGVKDVESLFFKTKTKKTKKEKLGKMFYTKQRARIFTEVARLILGNNRLSQTRAFVVARLCQK
jgi:hypothetical protein